MQYGTSGDANVEIIYNYQSPPTFSGGIYTVVPNRRSDGDLHGRPVDGRQHHADCQQLRQEFHPRYAEDGANLTGYNFGQIPPGSISGVVYYDANDNGVKDGNESGVGGVQLTLTGTNDLGQQITATLQSAADGTYDFPICAPAPTP